LNVYTHVRSRVFWLNVRVITLALMFCSSNLACITIKCVHACILPKFPVNDLLFALVCRESHAEAAAAATAAAMRHFKTHPDRNRNTMAAPQPIRKV